MSAIRQCVVSRNKLSISQPTGFALGPLQQTDYGWHLLGKPEANGLNAAW